MAEQTSSVPAYDDFVASIQRSGGDPAAAHDTYFEAYIRPHFDEKDLSSARASFDERFALPERTAPSTLDNLKAVGEEGVRGVRRGLNTVQQGALGIASGIAHNYLPEAAGQYMDRQLRENAGEIRSLAPSVTRQNALDSGWNTAKYAAGALGEVTGNILPNLVLGPATRGISLIPSVTATTFGNAQSEALTRQDVKNATEQLDSWRQATGNAPVPEGGLPVDLSRSYQGIDKGQLALGAGLSTGLELAGLRFLPSSIRSKLEGKEAVDLLNDAVGGVVARTFKAGGKAALGEGLTEGLQTYPEKLAEGAGLGEVFSRQTFEDAKDAAASAAVGSFGLGGLGANLGTPAAPPNIVSEGITQEDELNAMRGPVAPPAPTAEEIAQQDAAAREAEKQSRVDAVKGVQDMVPTAFAPPKPKKGETPDPGRMLTYPEFEKEAKRAWNESVPKPDPQQINQGYTEALKQDPTLDYKTFEKARVQQEKDAHAQQRPEPKTESLRPAYLQYVQLHEAGARGFDEALTQIEADYAPKAPDLDPSLRGATSPIDRFPPMSREERLQREARDKGQTDLFGAPAGVDMTDTTQPTPVVEEDAPSTGVQLQLPLGDLALPAPPQNQLLDYAAKLERGDYGPANPEHVQALLDAAVRIESENTQLNEANAPKPKAEPNLPPMPGDVNKDQVQRLGVPIPAQRPPSSPPAPETADLFTSEAPAAPAAPATKPTIKDRKVVNTETDDLMVAIRKLGGINVELESDFAGRLSHLNGNKIVGVGNVERTKGAGRSLDDLAEALYEYGYLQTRDAGELYDKLSSAESGAKHMALGKQDFDQTQADNGTDQWIERVDQATSEEEVASLMRAAGEDSRFQGRFRNDPAFQKQWQDALDNAFEVFQPTPAAPTAQAPAETDQDLFPAADAATRQSADKLALEDAQKDIQRKLNATQAPQGGGLFDLDNRQTELGALNESTDEVALQRQQRDPRPASQAQRGGAALRQEADNAAEGAEVSNAPDTRGQTQATVPPAPGGVPVTPGGAPAAEGPSVGAGGRLAGRVASGSAEQPAAASGQRGVPDAVGSGTLAEQRQQGEARGRANAGRAIAALKRGLASVAMGRPFRQFEKYGMAKGPAKTFAPLAAKDAALRLRLPVVPTMEADPTMELSIPARVDSATGKLYYNPNFSASRGEWTSMMVEELLHQVDLVGPNRSISSRIESLRPGGDLHAEAVSMVDAGKGPLADYLLYPLGAKFSSLKSSRVSAELFARLGVIYHGDPEAMQKYLPQAYEVYHALFRQSLLGPGESVLRDVRSGRSAGRGPGGSEQRVLPANDGGNRSGDGRGPTDNGLESVSNSVAQFFGVDPKGGRITGDLQTRSPRRTPEDLAKATQWTQDVLSDKLGNPLSVLLNPHQVADLNQQLPSASVYADAVDAMQAEAMKNEQRIGSLVERMNKLDKDQLNPLSDLMVKSTLSGIHVDKPFGDKANAHLDKDKNDDKVHEALVKRYEALSPEARAVYSEMRDHFADMWATRIQAVKDFANRIGVSGKEMTQLDTELAQLSRKVVGPYFPLMREGKYVVVWKSQALLDAEKAGNTAAVDTLKESSEDYWVRFTDSKPEARSLSQNRPERMSAEATGNFKLRTESSREVSGAGAEFVSKLEAALNDRIKDKETKEVAVGALKQVFMETLPDLSVMKRTMMRRGVAGVKSEDMVRAIAKAGIADAHYLARLTHADRITGALQNLRMEDADPKPGEAVEPGPGTPKGGIGAVYNLIAKSYRGDMMRPANEGFSAAANRLVELSYLHSLALDTGNLIANATQPTLTVLPMLGGRHGFMKSEMEMIRGLGDALKVTRARDYELDIGKISNQDGEQDALRSLRDMGVVELSMSRDMASVGRGDSLAYDGLRKFLAIPAHYVETVTRISSVLAAYRLELARARREEQGMGEEARKLQAIQYAARISREALVDFSPGGSPILMKGNNQAITKLAFQYKRFAISMLYLYAKTARDAMRSSDIQNKREAQKTLAAMLLAQFTIAGGLAGLPTALPAKLIASLWPTDDEDESAEDKLNRLADSLAGGNPTLSMALRKGPLSALTGADFSRKMGLSDLMVLNNSQLFEELKPNEKLSNQIASALMPSLGFVDRMYEGTRMAGDGDLVGAAMKFAPRNMISDIVMARRAAEEGMTGKDRTTRISPQAYQMNDLIAKSLGIPPLLETLKWEATNAANAMEKPKVDARERLLDAWVVASKKNDAEAKAEAQAKIDEYNSDLPKGFEKYRIKRQDQFSRVKSSKKSERSLTETGIKETKRNRPWVKELDLYKPLR